jgi:hypothetical protein
MPDPQITDRETLERWLEGRTREDAVVIAYRAAMRVAPYAWADVEDKQNPADLRASLDLRRAFLTFGAVIYSAVADLPPAASIADSIRRLVWNDAAEALNFALSAAWRDGFVRNAVLAVSSASDGLGFVGGQTKHGADAVVTTADPAAAEATYREVLADCVAMERLADPFSKALWQHNYEPIGRLWFEKRTAWSVRGPGAAFWITWYEKALRGEHDGPLLRDVATIPVADWEKGEAHVGGIIEGLVREHQAWEYLPGGAADLSAPGRAYRAVNLRAVGAQIDVLVIFLRDEIEALRGHNHATDSDRVEANRIEAILRDILARAEQMRAAVEPGGGSEPTALAVIKENLPAIAEKSEELTDAGAEPRLSASLLSFTASVKVLTEAGFGARDAAALVVLDRCFTGIKRAFSRKPQ